MRILFPCIAAVCWCLVISAPALADPQGQPLRPTGTPGLDTLVVATVPRSPELDKEHAGLPRNSRPEVLTWERVFALALLHYRARDDRTVEALVPSELAAEAKQHGVDDFARFRSDFLSAKAEGRMFPDPSAEYLHLQVRMQSIDSARRDLAACEMLLGLIREMIQGGSSGLTQLDVERLGVSLERARRRLDVEIGRYRNELDQFKVALGLSPHAAVLPDHANLAAFNSVFSGIDNWYRDPHRALDQLPVLADGLPVLGNVVVGERTLIDETVPNPSRIDELLTSATREAIKNLRALPGVPARRDAEVQLELRVRRRLRHLLEIQRAYDSEKHGYLLAVRQKDQTFERLVAPAAGVTVPRSPFLDALLDCEAEIRKSEVEVVRLCIEFRAERLALYREIGVLPYNDWKSFYEDLKARSAIVRNDAVAPGIAPTHGAGGQPPPPPPPPAPAPGSQPAPPAPSVDRQPAPPAPRQ